jgi:hypothetical protein
MDTIKRFFLNVEKADFNFAFLRIATALLTIIYVLTIYQDAPYLYGQNGLVLAEVNDALIDRINIRSFYPLLDWVSHDEVTQIALFLNFYLLVLGLLAIGFYSRVMAILAWFLNWVLLNSSFSLAYGYDIFSNNCLMYCALMPVGNHFAIDNWFRQKEISQTYQSISIRLLQFHLCIIYFFSGLNKIVSTQWWNGEAIWRSTMQPPMKVYNLDWLVQMPLLVKMLGIGAVLLEITLPLFIWNQYTRKMVMFGLITLHFSIGLFMGLWFFAFIMIILDITTLSRWNLRTMGVEWNHVDTHGRAYPSVNH